VGVGVSEGELKKKRPVAGLSHDSKKKRVKEVQGGVQKRGRRDAQRDLNQTHGSLG